MADLPGQVPAERKTPQSLLDAAARLSQAFSAPIDDNVLKLAVCAYVDEMKKLGAPVERVIIDVKRIAEAEIPPGELTVRSGALPAGAATSLNLAVTRCVEHYFWTDTSRA